MSSIKELFKKNVSLLKSVLAISYVLGLSDPIPGPTAGINNSRFLQYFNLKGTISTDCFLIPYRNPEYVYALDFGIEL